MVEISSKPYLTSDFVEKARVFDPFGHGGFDPLGHNKIDPFGQNKNDPCR